ncbi:MAG: rRNA maturation RNase YbeY [Candidatus Jacksonbacteria bacterium]
MQMHKIVLSIINKTDYKIKPRVFREILTKAKKFLKLDSFDELSVAIISQKEMQNINRVYRGLDEPTDVLSFDYGEILLCPEYMIKKYQLNKKGVQQKMQELFAHGVCHMAGLNHNTKQAEQKMKRLEQKILTW